MVPPVTGPYIITRTPNRIRIYRVNIRIRLSRVHKGNQYLRFLFPG